MKSKNCVLYNRSTDWNHFRNLITTFLNIPLKTEEDIELATELFITMIQEAASWDSTPISAPRELKLRFSKSITEKVAEKRRL